MVLCQNHSLLDIVVLCPHSDNIVILFGNNNNDFPTQLTYSVGENSWPMSIASGDFNSDDQLDIVIANFADQSVGTFISYYEADFAMQKKYSTGSGSRLSSLAVGDLNKDNILDIVVINLGN